MALTTDLLREAHRGSTRVEFLRYLTGRLFAFSGCDRLEIRLSHGPMKYTWSALTDSPEVFDFRVSTGHSAFPSARPADANFEWLCEAITTGAGVLRRETFAARGFFWAEDTSVPIALHPETPELRVLKLASEYRSLVMARLVAEGENVGLLILEKERPSFWKKEDCGRFRHIAETVGLAAADRRAQAALRERIKELTCLYGIALATARGAQPVDVVLQEIVELLPPSWQFPAIASARIRLDDLIIQTRRFHEFTRVQQAPVVVRNRPRGMVEVGYFEERPEFVEGPFLPEEKSLIEAVAQQIALIAERREDELERTRLKAQLHHADRLATIGQLSAGVAHELNEPLSNILGYAQLASKCDGLPSQAASDLQKITKASLHAREVIRKLMLYARQTPPRTTAVELNRLVREGLDIFTTRCAQGGIAIQLSLHPDLPTITADSAQLNQVLVNLVVNAIQAMPDGGTLSIATERRDPDILLTVRDSGTGMSSDILNKIFLPFFTTKDVDEGTGLGLAVVHGIVTAHGGSITASSQMGSGSCFVVRLPICRDEDAATEDADEYA